MSASAYLRSWLTGSSPSSSSQQSTSTDSNSATSTNASISLSIAEPEDEDEDDGDDDADSDATDTPPAFPALNSSQRLESSSTPSSSSNPSALPSILTDTHRMPPPPSPASALRIPGAPSPRAGLLPPPTASGLLSLPPSTTKTPTKNKFREKVALAPGYGPLDWAALKASGVDLRSVDTLLRVTPSMLKTHNKRADAWSVFNGKVYNITPYLPYHPGGEKELMRVAGRDGTKLFASTHAWVNVEFMLDACLVGFLVSESYGS